ncbi:hypothetical protein B0H11DRAFT_1263540 [Mycena galericulata]|nr:hypothetical protein B0H11DRAFT_1263540 [Mycena galericulata]
MSPIPTLLRTAIDLKEALDNAAVYLKPIGTCRSKATEWRLEYDEDKMDEDEDEDEDDSDSPLRENVEIKVMEELRKLQTDYTMTVASGTIEDLPFRLIITRKGCEYDGDTSALASDAAPSIGERLQGWYKAGAVSGYGDVKAQETKVDLAVRDAREIPASEFRVSPDLIARVQDIWGASFFPTQVRAEPYKIHLYGPGGKFKAHRDTPETDLVGTFLVGLGDTSRTTGWSGGAFEIKSSEGKWTQHNARLGSWVAFYPDVDHSVREIASGYRAVIGFKIFRQHLDTPEVPADVALRGKIKNVLMRLHEPYGILLQHHYSAGTAELNGLDAALYAAAGESGGDVKLLPVLIRWTVEKSYDYYGRGDDESQWSAKVFPMTERHVDTVLAHIRTKNKQSKDEDEEDEEEDQVQHRTSGSSKSKLFVDLKGTDAEWINYQSAESIRFYSPKFSDTSIVWREDVQDAIEHTGNESRPHAEDSIYLSYAVVVLPIKKDTRKAVDEEKMSEAAVEAI